MSCEETPRVLRDPLLQAADLWTTYFFVRDHSTGSLVPRYSLSSFMFERTHDRFVELAAADPTKAEAALAIARQILELIGSDHVAIGHPLHRTILAFFLAHRAELDDLFASAVDRLGVAIEEAQSQ